MKKLSNLLAALVFGSLVIFMSCGKKGTEPELTAKQVQAALLAGGPWSTASSANVSYGTGPSEGDWTNFKLTITANSAGNDLAGYSASGVPSGYEEIWPSSGSWSFVESNAQGTTIDRDDDIVITASNASATTLTLSFTVLEPDARVSGLYGAKWTFTFSKQ
jgi:hypothetical protein